MDVKAAVQIAKSYVSDLFSEEQIRNVGLEEVEFDETSREWLVTVGFARSWDERSGLEKAMIGVRRSYKVIRLSNVDGHVISVKDRRVAEAA
jgi:hypothetical protein